MSNINSLINQIVEFNNIYRNTNTSIKHKLEALWNIGDILCENKVKNPHSLGWKIQHETKGIIKRPTIFRSYKIRMIWPDKLRFLNECEGLQGLSNLIEMLPLLDPQQANRHKVPSEIINELKFKMTSMKPSKFKDYLDEIKNKYSDKTLGKGVDRQRYLLSYIQIVEKYNSFKQNLYLAITSKSVEDREGIRNKINNEELSIFANMCLAMTTKNNYKLYKYKNCRESNSALEDFKFLYDNFRSLLNNKSDIKRARLRRLINPLELAETADLCNSIVDEEKVQDYINRRQFKINL